MRNAYPHLEYKYLLMALIHDASEYVIGDMISPVKGYISGEFNNLKTKIEQAVHLRFGLESKIPVNIKKIIKTADLNSAYLEAIRLAGFTQEEALKYIGNPPANADKYCVKPLTTQ